MIWQNPSDQVGMKEVHLIDLLLQKSDYVTTHRVIYLNETIIEVECESCHKKIINKKNVEKEFYEEFCKKIIEKPAKMKDECLTHPIPFFSTFPLCVISKPYRLMRDLERSRKIIKKYSTKR
jgi:hypothetical protein